jgi:hypothetical protein
MHSSVSVYLCNTYTLMRLVRVAGACQIDYSKYRTMPHAATILPKS